MHTAAQRTSPRHYNIIFTLYTAVRYGTIKRYTTTTVYSPHDIVHTIKNAMLSYYIAAHEFTLRSRRTPPSDSAPVSVPVCNIRIIMRHLSRAL